MIAIEQWEPQETRLERARATAEEIEAIAELVKRAAAELGELALMGSASAIARLADGLAEQLAGMIDELTPIVREYQARQGRN